MKTRLTPAFSRFLVRALTSIVIAALFPIAPASAGGRPGTRLYGYDLGKDTFLVVEVIGNETINFWLHDPRTSPLSTRVAQWHSKSEFEELTLPPADLTREIPGVSDNVPIEFDGSGDSVRQLRQNGLFLVSLMKIEPETLLLDLPRTIAGDTSIFHSIRNLEPKDSAFKNRTFQIQPIRKSHFTVVNVIDSNETGEFRWLTLLGGTRTIIPLNGAFVDFDHVAAHPVLLQKEPKVTLKGQLLYEYAGSALPKFLIGRYPWPGAPGLKSLTSDLVRRPPINWEKIRRPEPVPLSEIGGDEPTSYDVHRFLMDKRAIRLQVSKEQFEEIVRGSPGEFDESESAQDTRGSTNQSSGSAGSQVFRRLNLTAFGALMYRVSENAEPIFLGQLPARSEVASFNEQDGQLRVVFEDGMVNHYDLRDGRRVFRQPSRTLACQFIFRSAR